MKRVAIINVIVLGICCSSLVVAGRGLDLRRILEKSTGCFPKAKVVVDEDLGTPHLWLTDDKDALGEKILWPDGKAARCWILPEDWSGIRIAELPAGEQETVWKIMNHRILCQAKPNVSGYLTQGGSYRGVVNSAECIAETGLLPSRCGAKSERLKRVIADSCNSTACRRMAIESLISIGVFSRSLLRMCLADDGDRIPGNCLRVLSSSGDEGSFREYLRTNSVDERDAVLLMEGLKESENCNGSKMVLDAIRPEYMENNKKLSLAVFSRCRYETGAALVVKWVESGSDERDVELFAYFLSLFDLAEQNPVIRNWCGKMRSVDEIETRFMEPSLNVGDEKELVCVMASGGWGRAELGVRMKIAQQHDREGKTQILLLIQNLTGRNIWNYEKYYGQLSVDGVLVPAREPAQYLFPGSSVLPSGHVAATTLHVKRLEKGAKVYFLWRAEDTTGKVIKDNIRSNTIEIRGGEKQH